MKMLQLGAKNGTLKKNYRMISKSAHPTNEIRCDSLESGDIFGSMHVEKWSALWVVFRMQIMILAQVKVNRIDQGLQQLLGSARILIWLVGR